MTKKRDVEFVIGENIRFSDNYSLLILEPRGDDNCLDDIMPGQFVEVKVPNSTTLLRRPISICNIEHFGQSKRLWLYVRAAGEGTRSLINAEGKGSATLSIILPLGNGYSINKEIRRPLLIGGGVGMAPLLYLGRKLKEQNVRPTFLFGARSISDMPLLREFDGLGEVGISTEDGSMGEKGLVTENSILNNNFDFIYTCGPMPMMKAVAKLALEKEISCEVSLENVMGCGIGACLCCVEKTKRGNICMCTDGPVLNIEDLLW